MGTFSNKPLELDRKLPVFKYLVTLQHYIVLIYNNVEIKKETKRDRERESKRERRANKCLYSHAVLLLLPAY